MTKAERKEKLLLAAERALTHGDGYRVLEDNGEHKLYDEMLLSYDELDPSLRCLHICLAAAQVDTGDLF